MGKEKFEDICVQNLSAEHFGKYVSGKLKVFSTARCCTEFTESPDFLFEKNNEYYGVEHFVIDLLYKEQEGVEGNYDSVYGTIAVKWRIENDQKKIWVKIPANATAYIELPGQQRQKMGNGVFEYTVCRI